MNCEICNKELIGLQKKFCSNKCKHKNHNNKFNDYEAQKIRGHTRRNKLIKLKNSKCFSCGYNKNTAALCFHHLEPSKKEFRISLRECSNSSWEKLLEEAEKCILLCHNCHMELHYPNQMVEQARLELAYDSL